MPSLANVPDPSSPSVVELLGEDGQHVCWGVCNGDRLYTARHCVGPARLADRAGQPMGDDLWQVSSCDGTLERASLAERAAPNDPADILVGFDARCQLSRADVQIEGEHLLIPFVRCPLERGASGLVVRVRSQLQRADTWDTYLISRRRSAGVHEELVAVRCERCAFERLQATETTVPIAGAALGAALLSAWALGPLLAWCRRTRS